MREIVSPLAGIRSPFGRLLSSTALSAYAVGSFEPDLVFDFEQEYYRTGGTETTFDSAMTFSRDGNATMVDSDGVLKWAPHNLVLNSATPATQSITVISGADYTIECTGVSIALSGAGTGTVTEGNPVTITASTTTLTLAVTGSTGTMWAYRSDLGGMVDNPDRGDSYVPTTSAARYLPRRGHHFWNGSEWEKGALFEPTEAVQLLHTTDTLVTQSHTVTAVPHTLHFTGTGTVTLSGASTAGPLVGTGTGEENRVSLTFTPTAASLTLTVSGTVTNAQLEVGSVPTSYIPNLAGSGTVTRAGETLTVPSANLPWPTPNVIGPELVTNGTFDTDSDWTKGAGWTISGGTADKTTADNTSIYQAVTTEAGKVYQVSYEVTVSSVSSGLRPIINSVFYPYTRAVGTYTVFFVATGTSTVIFFNGGSFSGGSIDNISVREIDPLAVSIQMDGLATGDTLTTTRWYLDANNYITQEIGTSDFTFEQANAGTIDAVTGGSFTSGVNTAFNFASTHASTLVAAAVSGTALTDNTTPTALADLSSTDLSLAYSGGPMILKKVRMWPVNITEAGREEASS